MAQIIEPRVLKGFRDALPKAESERRRLFNAVEAVFISFGFAPIDTPCLEYAEILFGKGGGETEKQVYRFNDHGGRDVALRFDLTVPFARFMAEHLDELALPFKRYHIAKVWRGENTQRGRYREFYQCDFDSVGSDCPMADFEILSLMLASLRVLGIGGFKIRLSHRGLFNRFLEAQALSSASVEVLRLVDKLAKIGAEEVEKQLSELVGSEKAKKVLDFIHPEVDYLATLDKMTALAGSSAGDTERLRALHALMEESGTSAFFVLDPSITRGLDYYTGLVFETFLDDLPGIGSVCSGGRYDDLASLYTKQKIPGVGASIGMDRLLAALETLSDSGSQSASASVLVLRDPEIESALPFKTAQSLREEGIACEVYTDKKKAGQQFAYAEKKGIGLALMAAAQGSFSLKTIATRESRDFPSLAEAVDAIRAILAKKPL